MKERGRGAVAALFILVQTIFMRRDGAWQRRQSASNRHTTPILLTLHCVFIRISQWTAMLSLTAQPARRWRKKMGVKTRCVIGILLLGVAQTILGITAFNEQYVFANVDVAPAMAHDVAEWLDVAQRHSHALFEKILPPDALSSITSVFLLALFWYPPLVFVLRPTSRKLQRFVFASLLGLLAIDVNNLLTFSGNNWEDCGTGRMDDFFCYVQHMLLGAGCLGYTVVRWLQDLAKPGAVKQPSHAHSDHPAA